MVHVALIISVDPKPVHLAGPAGLKFAYDGNVVLCLASNDTRIATDTRAQIDGHSPRVVFRRIFRVQGQLSRRYLRFFFGEIGMFPIFGR